MEHVSQTKPKMTEHSYSIMAHLCFYHRDDLMYISEQWLPQVAAINDTEVQLAVISLVLWYSFSALVH